MLKTVESHKYEMCIILKIIMRSHCAEGCVTLTPTNVHFLYSYVKLLYTLVECFDEIH